MQARKIVDPFVLNVLDSWMPKEIADAVLHEYTKQPKRVSDMVKRILRSVRTTIVPRATLNFLTDDFMLRDEDRPIANDYCSETIYANGVLKEVYRCSDCLAVQKVVWTYVKEGDITFTGIGRCGIEFWDCANVHSERGKLARECNYFPYPIIAEDRIVLHLGPDNVTQMVMKEGLMVQEFECEIFRPSDA